MGLNRILFGTFLTVTLVGCSTPSPGERVTEALTTSANGLHFLPPLVSEWRTEGTFDASLSPTVRIDRIDPAKQTVLGTVRRFDRKTGTQRIRVAGPSFEVLWSVGPDIDCAGTYRIHVLVSECDLGFVDYVPRANRGDRLVGEVVPVRFFLKKMERSACGVVPVSGGQVLHPSGAGVTVPPGTFAAPASVTVRLASAQVPPPAGFSSLGALDLAMPAGGMKPVKLFLPAPAPRPDLIGYVVARVVDLPSGARLSVVDTAAIHDGQLITNSPPFPGVVAAGTYVFIGVPVGAGLQMLRVTASDMTPLAGALVELVGPEPPSAPTIATEFVGVSASDGFTAIPVVSPAALAAASASAMGRTPSGYAAVGSAALGGPPPGFPLPEAIPTIPELIVKALLDKHKVEELPDFGALRCGPSRLIVNPHQIPESEASPPFLVGDGKELRVTGDDGQGYASSTEWRDVLAMPWVGYDMNLTLYRAFGGGSNPVPVAVSQKGVVAGVLPGFGGVDIAVSVRCARKWPVPGGGFLVVPQVGPTLGAQVNPIQVSPAEANLVMASFAAPASQSHVTVGDDLTAQFYLKNLGPAAADSAIVDVGYTAALDLLSAVIGSPSSGTSIPCSHAAGSLPGVVCDFGTLASQATAIAELHFHANSAGAADVVASGSSARHDPNPADNAAGVSWVIDVPDAGPVEGGMYDAGAGGGGGGGDDGGGDASGGGASGSGGTAGDAGGSGGVGAPPATFIVRSEYNLPINNPNLGVSEEPTFLAGGGGWYFGVTSAIGAASISTSLSMACNTCQRSNGVIGSTFVEVYVLGPPGTPFDLSYDWLQAVSASWTGTGPSVGAGTTYSQFGNITATADSTNSISTNSNSGSSTATGATSGTTTQYAGATYSLATTFTMNGGSGSNGQCFTCNEPPNCCACGTASVDATVNVVVH